MHLSGIYIYPIKGCCGIDLQRWHVESPGFRHDRRWMLVDRSNTFVSQRTHRKLATIKVELSDAHLVVSHRASTSIEIPVAPVHNESMRVVVWDDTVEGSAVAKSVDEWFSSVLDDEVRLVQLMDSSHRQVNQHYARPADEVGFADAFPYLLTTEGSLADLNSRLAEPVPMNRFRPNLVISDTAPFDEDSWQNIRIGAIAFRVAKPCARCAVPTVNQETGEIGKEPSATLAQYRSRNGKVYFGQNLLPDGIGTLHLGDPVEILSRKP